MNHGLSCLDRVGRECFVTFIFASYAAPVLLRIPVRPITSLAHAFSVPPEHTQCRPVPAPSPSADEQ